MMQNIFFAALQGNQVKADVLGRQVLTWLYKKHDVNIYGPCSADGDIASMRTEEALAYCDKLVIILSECEVSERAAFYCGVATAFSVPIVIVGRALTIQDLSNYTYLYYNGKEGSIDVDELMMTIAK